MRVGALEQVLDVLELVLVQNSLLVVALFNQVFHLFFQVVEEDGVLVDVLQEVLASCLTIRVELDLAIGIVEVQLGVQSVVIELWVTDFFYACVGEIFCQNSFSPSRTRETSSGVPSSSNLYIWGIPSFAATISPARQYAVPKFVFPDEMTPTQ